MSTSIGLVGAGAAATALAPRLREAGFEVRCWARDRERAAGVAPPVTLEELAALDLAWILVSDRAIAEVAARLADAGPPPLVLHGSGFHGTDVLAPLAAAGVATGALHPLVSFPAGERAPDLAGASFGLAGDERARAAGRALAGALGAHVLELPGDADTRAAYHAAAALTANGLVALVDLALEALGPEVDRAAAARALAHLGCGALGHVAAHGTQRALTGPIVRGDAAVVAGHLAALPPEAREVYRRLAGRMLTLARARGLDSAAADALRQALDE